MSQSAWIVFFLILVVVELSTVNLVSIWFAVGAIASYITTYFTDSGLIQWSIFVLVSFISFLLTRPFVKKWHPSFVKTNLDQVIGSIGVVTEDILPLQVGEVKVNGKKWSAISEIPIKKGSNVTILSIAGVKLCVEQVKEEV